MYLTWGETPRASGVFGSQAIEQFVANGKAMPNSSFFFASAVPLLHSGLVRERSAYSREKEEVKRRLGDIPFFWLPIYAPQTLVFSGRHSFPLMHLGARWHLMRLINRIEPDVIHCRSYHAAYAALKVREKLEKKFKVVFDARGIWSAEVALKNNLSEASKNFDFLRQLEKWIVQESDAVISVSPQMRRYFEAIGCKKSECIFLSAPVEKLSRLDVQTQTKEESGELAVVYLGTLGVQTWHKPSELIALYKHILSLSMRVKLKIITMSSHEAISSELEAHGIRGVEIISTKTMSELGDALANMEIGVLSYFKPRTKNEKLLSSVVMAVKTAEYLSAGLPILVNKYCGGAAEVVSNNSIGIAYDPDTFEEITEKSLKSLRGQVIRQRSVSTARDIFDVSANARRYVNVYRQIS